MCISELLDQSDILSTPVKTVNYFEFRRGKMFGNSIEGHFSPSLY